MIEFNEFWSQYPRRVGRYKAEKCWQRMPERDKYLALEALALWKQTAQWNSGGGLFIPYASTYLHQQRWLDEPFSGAFEGARSVDGVFSIPIGTATVKRKESTN
jgi:hypothetical protein